MTAREKWKAAKAALDKIVDERNRLVAHTQEAYLAASEALDEAEDGCGDMISYCTGCAEPIFDGEKHTGGETPLCLQCAPTYQDLLSSPELFGFDENDEPLSNDAAKKIVNDYVASGGSLSDSMAT